MSTCSIGTVVATVGLMLLAGVIGPGSVAPPSAASSPASTTPLEIAVKSLEGGHSPFGNLDHACLSVGGAVLRCPSGTSPTPVSPGARVGGPSSTVSTASAGVAGTPPPYSGSMSMTYDAADRYVLLFVAGLTGQYTNQTWVFQNSSWSQLHPAHQPSGRDPAAMVYDPALRYVVFFGGCCNPWPPMNDTWAFHAGRWTLLHPSSSPSGRYHSGATYDSADRLLVLFGGTGISGPLDDTWTFDRTGWHNVTGPVHPQARAMAAMANDIPDGYVLLYGGQTGTVIPTLFNDTWTYKAGSWTRWNTSVSPSVFQGETMQMDRADGYVLLFGGQNITSKLPSNETWKFSSGVWSKVGSAGTPAPAPRFYPGLAFDTSAGAIVLYGGGDGGNIFNDTWEFSAGTWTFLF